MNRSFRLLSSESVGTVVMVALVFLIPYLTLIVLGFIRGSGDQVYANVLPALLGVLLVAPMLAILPITLEISDDGLTVKRVLGKNAITWDEINRVTLVKTHTSFNRRWVISACIFDAHDRNVVGISGAAAGSGEIMDILRAHLPDRIVRILVTGVNETLEPINLSWVDSPPLAA